MSDIPVEAIDAAGEAIWNFRPASREWDGAPKAWAVLKEYQRERYRAMVSAAFPFLRRAIIQELADEAGVEEETLRTRREWKAALKHDTAENAHRWLTARLEQDTP